MAADYVVWAQDRRGEWFRWEAYATRPPAERDAAEVRKLVGIQRVAVTTDAFRPPSCENSA